MHSLFLAVGNVTSSQVIDQNSDPIICAAFLLVDAHGEIAPLGHKFRAGP